MSTTLIACAQIPSDTTHWWLFRSRAHYKTYQVPDAPNKKTAQKRHPWNHDRYHLPLHKNLFWVSKLSIDVEFNQEHGLTCIKEALTTQTSPKAPRPMTLTSSKSSRARRRRFSAVATGLTVDKIIIGFIQFLISLVHFVSVFI